MTYHLIQNPPAWRQFDSLNAARHAGDTDAKYNLIFQSDNYDRLSLIWAKVDGKFLTVPENVGEGTITQALQQAIDWMGAAHTAGATA